MSHVVPHEPLPAQTGEVEYAHGPMSERRPDVPEGRLSSFAIDDPARFPGTHRTVWVHVPAGLDISQPHACTIFQDAMWYLDPARSCRATIVLDNLVHDGVVPPMVGVFVEPGAQRNLEYDTFSSTYADFLVDEVLPQVAEHVTLSADPWDRALVGGSSSGNGSLTAAWHRPDEFRRVVGFNSSFAQIPGGNPYPALLAGEARRPLKVLLMADHRDLQWNEPEMNWFAENLEVAASLARAGYDMRLVLRESGHAGTAAGALLPDALAWVWGSGR